MLKRYPILVSVIVLLIASLACSQSAPLPPPDPNALNTSIAQTVAARQTEAARNNPATATFTSMPEMPTQALEPTFSATPDFTPTSGTPLISVSVDTNCRTGPGAIFERVGILLVGETAEIVGRETKGEYWYIRNPDEGPENCWVWGEYATVTGNLLPLLYLSPAPPSSVNFDLSSSGLESCNKTWWADFRLVNSSGGLFRSISINLTDADTLTVTSLTENGFTNKDGCNAPSTVESLIAGGALTVSSAPLGYDPSGNNLNVKITVCTGADQQGTCLTRELTFRP
ncbi:MAG TPA: SH3 domain-containing protein [Anaerolineales bacterium]